MVRQDDKEEYTELDEFERMITRSLAEAAARFVRETNGMTDEQKREYVRNSMNRHKYVREN